MTNSDRGEHQQLMATIASNIRSCRRKLGWSQEELGNRSALSLKAIGEIERGNRAVSVKSLFQIAKALNVTPSELLMSTPKPDPLEERLRKFVLHARQNHVTPRFVDLCTDMILEATTGEGADLAKLPVTQNQTHPSNGNGNGHSSGNGNGKHSLVGASTSASQGFSSSTYANTASRT